MRLRKPGSAETGADAADQGEAGPIVTTASKIGAELRAARLRLGWQLADISNGLRIRLPYLEALEDGRTGDLPGAAYAVGFVRTYAKALGLDADEVARRFRSEQHEVNRKTELTFPVPVPERGVPAGAVVLLGLVLAIGAYAAWYKFAPQHSAETTMATVPERLAPLAERSPPSNVSPQVASVLPAAPAPSPAATTPPQSPSPAIASSAAPSPTSAQAAPALPLIPVPVPVPVSMTPVTPLAGAPAATVSESGRVVLRFKADSYIQVREKQGPVLLNRVMHSGETWPVPKEANLVMVTGNAGGTEILVDGITAATLGPNGAVRRDVSLEPDAIKLPPGVKLPAQPRAQ